MLVLFLLILALSEAQTDISLPGMTDPWSSISRLFRLPKRELRSHARLPSLRTVQLMTLEELLLFSVT